MEKFTIEKVRKAFLNEFTVWEKNDLEFPDMVLTPFLYKLYSSSPPNEEQRYVSQMRAWVEEQHPMGDFILLNSFNATEIPNIVITVEGISHNLFDHNMRGNQLIASVLESLTPDPNKYIEYNDEVFSSTKKNNYNTLMLEQGEVHYQHRYFKADNLKKSNSNHNRQKVVDRLTSTVVDVANYFGKKVTVEEEGIIIKYKLGSYVFHSIK